MENNMAPTPNLNGPTPEQQKLSTILCVISLVLMFGAPAIAGVISGIGEASDIKSLMQAMSIIALLISSVSYIGAWVLVIIARVKCKTTFSKVLLIIYIALLVLEILSIVFIVVWCIACSNQCSIPG